MQVFRDPKKIETEESISLPRRMGSSVVKNVIKNENIFSTVATAQQELP